MDLSDLEDELVAPASAHTVPQHEHDCTASLFDDSDDDIPIAQLFRKASGRPTTSFPTTIPSFTPLLLPAKRTNRTGRPNLHCFRSKPRKPLAFFLTFLPLSIFETIAANTNKYATAKGAGAGRSWTETSGVELQAFVGICLYMGLFPSPRVEDYWERGYFGPYHRITNVMPLKRFQQLKRYLHVSDHTSDGSSEFFFKKLEPLLQHFLDASKKLWVPATNVSVDEMMVMCYGRSAETVRLRNKPIGSGFKIWSLCDRGYLFDAFPHSNRYPWRFCSEFKGKLSHASAVVAALSLSLPRRPTNIRTENDVIYCIFMDNLFSSPALFKYLRDKEIAAVGTVRSNTKGFPKCLAVRKRNVNLPWNTLGAALCANGGVLALTWIDNGAVQMLTTKHEVGAGHTVHRTRKRPRLTSTNGAIVREVFGSRPTAVLPIPTVVDDYNLFMGGVDIADQLRSVYTCHLTSRRTWLPLFFWILDSCASNAYIILSAIDKKWDNSRKHFIRALAWSLVDCYERTKSKDSKRVNKSNYVGATNSTVVNGNHLFPNAYNTKRRAQSMVSLMPSSAHFPVKVADHDRRACVFCRIVSKKDGNAQGKRQKASFKCADCGYFLCIDRNRHCFMQFHKAAFDRYNTENEHC